MISVGRRISKERRDREWSQRFLGQLIGVTGSCIYNYEKGMHRPHKDKIRLLEALLEINLEEDGSDERSDTRK